MSDDAKTKTYVVMNGFKPLASARSAGAAAAYAAKVLERAALDVNYFPKPSITIEEAIDADTVEWDA